MILLVKNCILEKVKNVISYLDKCVNENILPDSVVTKTQQCSWTSTRKVSIVLKTLAFQTLQTKLVITADVTMLAHMKKDCNDMKKIFKLFKIKHDMRLVSLIAITAVYSFTNCSHCRLTWPSLAWLHLRSSQHIASVATVGILHTGYVLSVGLFSSTCCKCLCLAGDLALCVDLAVFFWSTLFIDGSSSLDVTCNGKPFQK